MNPTAGNNASAITHVADTALWVATYRALESRRSDALFRDPLAESLAGERGRNIAASMPYPRIMAWALVIRTVAIDALIVDALALGIDAVINLGAGLDTRPYRMNLLPRTLRWIEVDFPQMMDYKSEMLEAERPVCRLERIAADLSDIPLRRSIFQRLGSENEKVLIITEGVLAYLSSADAGELARDLFAVPTFQYWIQDYYMGGTKRWAPRRMRDRLKDSPFRFEEPDWLSFFERHGWTISENRVAADEAERLKRPFPLAFPWTVIIRLLPAKVREKWRNSSGYVMYTKPTSATKS
jgi:methyltransferase (TIGR00027 family)